ncbi:MAG: KH domain-containing protein [Erysipelotrichaceae bacterium]|nr:KH domain-containing protein [Erysipelotrichaceae bacterium]
MIYEEIVRTIIEPIVEEPKALLIREIATNGDDDITIVIVANNDDTARLIGRKGVIAEALREVISIAGKQDQRRLRLKFESFENKSDE